MWKRPQGRGALLDISLLTGFPEYYKQIEKYGNAQKAVAEKSFEQLYRRTDRLQI
jgi:hypothetical protein